jgi:hypothetical protein
MGFLKVFKTFCASKLVLLVRVMRVILLLNIVSFCFVLAFNKFFRLLCFSYIL